MLLYVPVVLSYQSPEIDNICSEYRIVISVTLVMTVFIEPRLRLVQSDDFGLGVGRPQTGGAFAHPATRIDNNIAVPVAQPCTCLLKSGARMGTYRPQVFSLLIPFNQGIELFVYLGLTGGNTIGLVCMGGHLTTDPAAGFQQIISDTEQYCIKAYQQNQ